MRRGLLYGSGMALYVVLVAGALVIVNLFSSAHYKRVDMSQAGVFTLSGQTIKTLKALKDNITIYAFMKPDNKRAAEDLLGQYAYESPKVALAVIDPDNKPFLAKKYNVSEYGTIVVETASGRKESTRKLAEQDVTNAIIKATTSRQKKIYLLAGHNERDIKGDKPRGWKAAKQALESAMYKVAPLNWFNTGKTPDDVDLLVIAGPQNDFQPVETDRIRKYLDSGGKLLAALDPVSLPELEKLLSEYGFKFGGDMIVDPLSQQLGLSALYATVTRYGGHPVVKDFKAATFFPVARSIEPDPANIKKARLKPLLETAAQGWSETDLKSIEKGRPVFSALEDKPGPRILAVSAQWDTGRAREERKIGEKSREGMMIVVGDSDFASNSSLGLSANKDLFLNMVGWLLEEDTAVTIRPKSTGFNPILFTSSQLATIFWTVVVALPLCVVAFGVAVRIWRRKS